MTDSAMTPWTTDEACVEARGEIYSEGCAMHECAASLHMDSDHSKALDAYARAVAVACLKDVLHGYAGTATAEEVRARAERMLAELGGAE